MTLALLALYFAILLGALLYKGQAIHNRWLFLFRAFLPNWKFFDIVGHVPHLFASSARAGADGELVWSDPLLIYPRRTRRWTHLLHNPDTNLALGQQNLVDHFWADLYDLPDGADPRQLVTYAMVERLVREELTARHGPHTHRRFELRMVLDGPEGVSESYTMMESPTTTDSPVKAC